MASMPILDYGILRHRHNCLSSTVIAVGPQPLRTWPLSLPAVSRKRINVLVGLFYRPSGPFDAHRRDGNSEKHDPATTTSTLVGRFTRGDIFNYLWRFSPVLVQVTQDDVDLGRLDCSAIVTAGVTHGGTVTATADLAIPLDPLTLIGVGEWY